MKKYFIVFALLSLFISFMQSCKKDENEGDKTLFAEATATGYTFYQNKDSILSAAGNSPHGKFKLRFNATAQAALDSTGELPTGSLFPAGSIIVKEVYSNTFINLFAVMKKESSNGNAGNGWLWAEYKTDGSAQYSISEKGGSCISCHSNNPHRDFTRTFDLH